MTAKKTTTKKKAPTKEQFVSMYMDYVLEHEMEPKTIYKFCKEHKVEEQDFYQFFGSFTSLRKEIWNMFFENSITLMHKSPEVETYSSREKMLTLFYTFFENLTANRSYVLFTLEQHNNQLKNMDQLKGLRKHMRAFAKELIEDDNDEKQFRVLQRSETIYAEAAWVQLLFLINFWRNDNSANFEKTDMAIEKSVNTIFDVFDNTPLERVIDFGKFLYKEARH
ncbi:TetR family transcriptional regulator C-terminal domain-containing protein [Gangjinia marincola]|uniref:TetR family transcriptional regulator C-terminal domain-containing protein n=1 Tax=Gangjinia marincola TaxID=578463 RepID=A0ABP3XRN1_9FLAO